MALKEEIDRLLKESLKSGDKKRVSVYRLLKSEIRNREVEVMHPLSDDEVMQVISSMIKKRRESVEQYREGGREDLARAEEEEISILQELLPPQLSREELISLIKETMEELGAHSQKDFGKVMRAVMAKVKGRADGKEVNLLVRELLEKESR